MRQLKIANQLTRRDSDAIDKYLNEIAKRDLLTFEEEQELGRRIRLDKDPIAVNKLVEANLRFVVSVAKQYQSDGLQLMDLVNEGNIGLVRAAWKFDETRGFKFISYAVWWIRQAIMSAITYKSRTIKLPLNRVNEIIEIQKASAQFISLNQREPTSEELAEMTEMSSDHIEFLRDAYKQSTSLNAPLKSSDDGNTLLDTYQDNSFELPDQKFDRQSSKQEIRGILSLLSEREKQIIQLCFGLDQNRALTFNEIADKYHMTPERARQIKHRAILKLQKHKSAILN